MELEIEAKDVEISTSAESAAMEPMEGDHNEATKNGGLGEAPTHIPIGTDDHADSMDVSGMDDHTDLTCTAEGCGIVDSPTAEEGDPAFNESIAQGREEEGCGIVDSPTAEEGDPASNESIAQGREEEGCGIFDSPTAEEGEPASNESIAQGCEEEGCGIVDSPTVEEGGPTSNESIAQGREEEGCGIVDSPTGEEGDPASNESIAQGCEEEGCGIVDSPTVEEGGPTSNESIAQGCEEEGCGIVDSPTGNDPTTDEPLESIAQGHEGEGCGIVDNSAITDEVDVINNPTSIENTTVQGHEEGCGPVQVGVVKRDTPGPDKSDEEKGVANSAADEVGVAMCETNVSEDKTESTEPKVTRRMTRAERAAQEALAEFGGSGLGSMSVRKIDLRKKLNREAEKMKEDEKKAVNEPQPKRPRTRLQALKEAPYDSLGVGAKKKYPKVTMAQRNAKRKAESDSKQTKHMSKVERSRNAVIESFDGASLDDLPMKKKPRLQSAHTYSLVTNPKKTAAKKIAPKKTATHHRLTRAEQARLEAIKSFGGNSLDNVLDGATRKVSRTLNPKPAKSGKGDEESAEDAAPEGVVSTITPEKENLVET